MYFHCGKLRTSAKVWSSIMNPSYPSIIQPSSVTSRGQLCVIYMPLPISLPGPHYFKVNIFTKRPLFLLNKIIKKNTRTLLYQKILIFLYIIKIFRLFTFSLLSHHCQLFKSGSLIIHPWHLNNVFLKSLLSSYYPLSLHSLYFP